MLTGHYSHSVIIRGPVNRGREEAVNCGIEDWGTANVDYCRICWMQSSVNKQPGKAKWYRMKRELVEKFWLPEMANNAKEEDLVEQPDKEQPKEEQPNGEKSDQEQPDLPQPDEEQPKKKPSSKEKSGKK